MVQSEIDLSKGIPTINKLCIHGDADGLASGVLIGYVSKVNNVWSPEEFGDAKDSDVVLDQVPVDPTQPYIVFDHHSHPPKEKRKYQLVWDQVPATLIVYECFKAQIPDDMKWKVAVGLVGDGQPELIPLEVWKLCPELLTGYATASERYGKLSIYSIPLYLKLSSGINACCKLSEDKWYNAYQVLKNVKTPLQLIEDPVLETALDFIRKEHDRVIREYHPIEFPYFRYWKISSDYRMERHLAPKVMEGFDRKTTIIFNEKTKRMSIRGTLTPLLVEFLKANNIQANGHPGFAGGNLTASQNPDDLYKVLKKFRI